MPDFDTVSRYVRLKKGWLLAKLTDFLNENYPPLTIANRARKMYEDKDVKY